MEIITNTPTETPVPGWVRVGVGLFYQTDDYRTATESDIAVLEAACTSVDLAAATRMVNRNTAEVHLFDR